MDEGTRARQLHRSGRVHEAEAAYRAALARSDADDVIQHDYALLLLQAGRPGEASELLRSVVTRLPGQIESRLLLSMSLRDCGRLDEACEVAAETCRRVPGEPRAVLIRGIVELAAGRPLVAEANLRTYLDAIPTDAEAWHYLGETLQRQRRWTEAIDAYRRAMHQQPLEALNIAMCAELAGLHDLATASYAAAARAAPGRPDVLVRLAQHQSMRCDFHGEAATLDALARVPLQTTSGSLVETFPLSYLPVPSAMRYQAIQRYAAAIASSASQHSATDRASPEISAPRPGRLRIGYASADFGAHAVGHLLKHHFAAHDRELVEVFAYSLRQHIDPVADAIARGCDTFRDCSALSTEAIVQRIRADRIDVLIDLGGFTQGARPQVLARRPAPVQLGWLGHIDGQCASWLDGLLMDEAVQPEQAPWPFTDDVVRMPAPMMPAGPMPPGTRNRAQFDLPGDAVVLASFNNSYKLDADLTAAWAQILRGAPDAWLMLYLPDYARSCFLEHWQALSGDRERLMLVDNIAFEAQADRAATCDLHLDAFRYQAGATALASIAAGLPTLCMRGTTPVGRLGVSLNLALGLEELICDDRDAYVATAIRLANQPEALSALRHDLPARAQAARLFDPRRSAETIERIAAERVERVRGANADVG